MEKFYIHSMGCKSNQFEGDLIKDNLIKNGMIQSDRIEDADIYILNSCTVTHKSDNEAMYLLRNAKHKNNNVKTIITGCVAQIEKEELLKNDFIDFVIGNDEKFDLYKILRNENQDKCFVNDIMNKRDFTKVSISDLSKTRANVKIQDGCDNRCSYCIIPFARGKSRSADIDFIINQINSFSENGFKEVVLTGIHIGQWGRDIGLRFIDLIKAVEEKTQIQRFRLGSLNPSEIDDELLQYLSKSKKFCPHFHLSLQSACDKTLKNMNRFYKTEDYLNQIEKINTMFELPFLGSDIITGFAGEGDDDFEETCKNLRKSGLSKIHTFPYSIRKGTKGAVMNDMVDEAERQKRADVVKRISDEKYKEFLNKNAGKVHEVLIEKHKDKNTGLLKGVTRNYITVLLDSSDEKLLNTLCHAKIVKIENNKVYAQIEKYTKIQV